MRNLLYALPVATLILAGCGGGGSSLSGPDSNTQQGLGTLVVRVGGFRVNGGASIVTLDNQGVKVVRDGSVTFFNVTPGRHFVEARYQTINAPSSSRSVDIEADRTRTVTLNLNSDFAPTPTRSPFGD